MARAFVGIFVVAWLLAPASAGATPIAQSMGDLRWGLSEDDVVRFLVRKVKERAREESAKASASKKSEIERQLERQLRQIRESLVRFEGSRTRWDSGPVADQFTHGNQEAMIAYDDGRSRNYYFFINHHLWKWYKSFPASDFGGRDFKRFSKTITKKYGTGRVKSGEMYAGTGEERQWLEYLDRNTRLRAVDKTNPHGEYALVFEEMATVRDLASLRVNQGGPNRTRVASRRPAPEPAEDEDEEQAPARTASASKSKYKSIEDDTGQRGETRAEYEERKKRVIAAEKAKQRALYERKEDKKQGKTLDALAGINDDDPISGMR